MLDFIRYYAQKSLGIVRQEVFSLPTKVLLFASILLLLVLPVFYDNPYLLRILTFACIFAMFTASWDLLAGIGGQFSFGHTLFFGASAYVSALLNLHFGLPVLLAIFLGALAGVFAGLLLGIPGLRLRGPYFSLASLAVPVIMSGLVMAFPEVTGGELGVSGIDRLAENRTAQFYLALTIMLAATFAMWKIGDSKIGLIFHAIREDEIAVRASGINTYKYKMLVFACSGFFAGIAGGMYAHTMRVVGPSVFDMVLSLQIIVWAVFGGIGTIYGSALGVLILYTMIEYLRVVPEYRMLIFAVLVIVVLRLMPEGIVVWIQDFLEVECPRCKQSNFKVRGDCRICGTALPKDKAMGLKAKQSK